MLNSQKGSPRFLGEAGIAPIAIIIAVVLVIAAAGGYFALNKNSSSPLSQVANVIPAVGLNPNCKHNDPELCKFLNNWKDLKQYSVKSTMTSKGAPTSTTLLEISGEDKFHMLSSENNKESYNTITIGDTTYTKDYSDNKWWKQVQKKQKDDPKEKFNFKFDEDKTDKPTEDKTTYKSLGKESCASLNCFKYQVINPDNSDFTEFIWFDDKEYRLRKEAMEGKDGSKTESEFSYSGVNISAPSPTKDASPDQIIAPTGAALPGLSEQEKKEIQKATDDTKNITTPNPEIPAPDDSSTGE